MKKLIFVSICLLVVTPSQARIITVDDDAPADFNNIQVAINDSNDGDIIEVQPGIYTGEGNRNIDFTGKAITVRSTEPNDPRVVEETVIDCQGSGRGFYFHNSEGPNSVVDGLTITNGYSSRDGGAIYCFRTSPRISQCIITNNSAYDNGGGIYCYRQSNPTISHCTITDNSARNGGAIYGFDNNLTIVNCRITGNSTLLFGGGIYCSASSPVIRNCIIEDNSAGTGGGGIYCKQGSTPMVEHCTLTKNSASKGGALYCYDNCDPTFSNCILWSDRATYGPEVWLNSSPRITVSYSDVDGDFLGEGNIDTDPLFADPLGGDYHLSDYSPCINAGDPNYSGEPGGTDIDGDQRIINGRVDIGSDELSYEGAILEALPIKFSFHAYDTGPNPEAQFLTIRNRATGAMRWEIIEDCSWLEVNPTNGKSFGEIDEVTLSLDTSGIISGIYNCEITVRANDTINSPQAVRVILQISSDYALHVPSEYETIQAAIDAAVDGDVVIVAPGTYTGDGNRDIDFLGKAITVSSADPNDHSIVTATIIDCEGTKTENHRGFYFHSGESKDSVLTGLTITGGYISTGGGIYCYNSSPTIMNCRILGNKAEVGTADGGGIYFRSSRAIISSCQIVGNSAGDNGGAIYCKTTVTINNCLICGNDTEDDGGGIYCTDTSPNIINCTLAGNRARGGWSSGGAIHCNGYNCKPLIANCILWGNTGSNNKEIWKTNAAKPKVIYCDVRGGYLGKGNINSNPLFVGPIITDYYLLPDSPCIDAGDPDYITEPNETDLDGRPRVIGSAIDMGAYESDWVWAEMNLTPKKLNITSKGNWLKAHIKLPAGYRPEDVDVNEPAMLLPLGIESEFIEAFEEDNITVVEATFSRQAVCDGLAGSENNTLDVTVIGSLSTGQDFYGEDTVQIKAARSRPWK